MKGTTVVCKGRRTRPHPPRLVWLPPVRVVSCPLCGRRFRRASGGVYTTPAVWPKRF